jgi:hypothetical protein
MHHRRFRRIVAAVKLQSVAWQQADPLYRRLTSRLADLERAAIAQGGQMLRA